MYYYTSTSLNELDQVRRSQGANALKSMFLKSGLENSQNAINQLNSENLTFTSLFLLQPEISELNLRDNLSQRNQTALSICKRVTDGKTISDNSDMQDSPENEQYHKVLLWMFKTGSADDGLSDEFDQIIDILASILIKTHHEKSILPIVVDVIFKRNQKELYIHDLVWACFLSRDLDVLRLIAEHLVSSNPRDVELAKKLLHLQQESPRSRNVDNQSLYTAYLSWLKDNNPYIYFTGESFNLTNCPSHCSVDLEAKYLCKENVICVSKQNSQLADYEQSCLNSFNKLQDNDKAVLARHSQKIYRENPSYWNQWIKLPLDKQIYLARHSGGNSYGCYR